MRAGTTLAERVNTPGSRDRQRFELVMGWAEREFRPGRGNFALEVGPGDGTFAMGFFKLGYAVATMGLEPPEAAAWVHRQVDFDADRTQRLGLAEEFDLVHVGQVIEHVRRPERVMAAAMYKAKPGGLVIVSAPDFVDPDHVRTYTEVDFYAFCRAWFEPAAMETVTGKGRTCFIAAGRKGAGRA